MDRYPAIHGVKYTRFLKQVVDLTVVNDGKITAFAFFNTPLLAFFVLWMS